MSEINAAISTLDDIKLILRDDMGEYGDTFSDAINIAISALVEKRDREKGCDYCNDSKHLYHEDGPISRMNSYVCVVGKQLEADLWQSGNSGFVIDINNCPMCGNALPSKFIAEYPDIDIEKLIDEQVEIARRKRDEE